MRFKKTVGRSVCISVLVLGIHQSIKITHEFLFSIPRITCVVIGPIAHETVRQLQAYCDSWHTHELPVHIWVNNGWSKRYAWVEQVCYSFKGSHHLECRLHAQNPVCWIGNNTVLLPHGKLNSAYYYDRTYCSTLSSIIINPKYVLSSQAYQFLSEWVQKTDRMLLDRGVVIWAGPYNILICPHDAVYGMRVTHACTTWEDALHERINKIIAQKKINGHKKYDKKMWIADVRFEKQIILSLKDKENWYNTMKMGEQCYGKICG